MGKGSSAPPPPDPYATASAEAQFNRVDTYSPDGAGVRYGYTDANGQFVQGVAPEGSQSAVLSVESPFMQSMRQLLEPSAQYFMNTMVGQNVLGLPGTPQVQNVGQMAMPGMTAGVAAPSTGMISQVQGPDQSLISGVAAPNARNTRKIADDFYNRSFSLLRPQIEQQENRLVNNLQARGIPIGGEAFNEAYGAQQREVGDTLSRLAMDANLAAGQEQSRLYGMDLNRAQFQQGDQNRLFDAGLRGAQFQQGEQGRLYGIGADQAQFQQNEGQRQFGNQGSLFNMALQNQAAAGDEQNRRFNLDAANRGRALSEIMALMGGQYMPPSSVPSGNVAGVNYGGMVQQGYQNELANWQQQQQNRMGMASTLGSLGSMLIKSSIHSKNILGEMDSFAAGRIVQNLPLYVWSYKDGADKHPHLGPTAQDFHQMTGMGTPEHISVIDWLGLLTGALQQAIQRVEMLEREMRYRGSEH